MCVCVLFSFLSLEMETGKLNVIVIKLASNKDVKYYEHSAAAFQWLTS